MWWRAPRLEWSVDLSPQRRCETGHAKELSGSARPNFSTSRELLADEYIHLSWLEDWLGMTSNWITVRNRKKQAIFYLVLFISWRTSNLKRGCWLLGCEALGIASRAEFGVFRPVGGGSVERAGSRA